MQNITVKKIDLLATLHANRIDHVRVFDETTKAYRAESIAELEDMLRAAKSGEEIRRSFNLPIPVSHADDFDTAIKMLEWDVNDEVELAEHEFENLVLNQWSWSGQFANTSSTYGVQSIR